MTITGILLLFFVKKNCGFNVHRASPYSISWIYHWGDKQSLCWPESEVVGQWLPMQEVNAGFGNLLLEISLCIAVAIQNVITEQQLAISVDLEWGNMVKWGNMQHGEERKHGEVRKHATWWSEETCNMVKWGNMQNWCSEETCNMEVWGHMQHDNWHNTCLAGSFQVNVFDMRWMNALMIYKRRTVHNVCKLHLLMHFK